MKYVDQKISTKLAVGFILLSSIASLTIGIVFLNIFYKSHLDAKVDSLLAYATQLSTHNEQYSEEDMVTLYDRLIDARVWILRENQLPLISKGDHEQQGEVVVKGCGDHKGCEIKAYDNKIIQEILRGNQIVQKSTTDFYYGKTLSVGVPIREGKSVVGAVLIHAPLDTVHEPIIKAAWYLLIGMLLSSVLMMILAVVYARDFTKPIRQMKESALELMKGNYDVKTGIKRSDELGDLSDALDTLAYKLEEARSEGEKLEHMRKDFVSNVSHEFRTPLTIIRGNTEALVDGVAPDLDQAYENIYKETMIMERLVTDLLDLTRLQQNQIQLDQEPIDIVQVISDAVRSSRQVAYQKGVTIEMSLEPYEQPVLMDYLRLRQVLMILLDNSIKYTAEGGLVKVVLEVQESICISIEDTGIGIAPEDLPRIWERFYKVDPVRNGGTSSGIGLAIAKSLIDLLEIKVEVHSVLGKGTCVRLVI